jgi:hypothetical protein
VAGLVLKSEKGYGTEAQVWLPIAKSDPMSKIVEGPKEDAVDRHNPPLIILAVDDDPLVLMNTTSMLEDAGIRSSKLPRRERRCGFSTTMSVWT